jgi:hypothetical protein
MFDIRWTNLANTGNQPPSPDVGGPDSGRNLAGFLPSSTVGQI